jgi:hypothetical protein
MKELVGPPGFEPGTSCTPNTWPACLGSVAAGIFYALHGFGASASARCRRRWIEFLAHFCAQSTGAGCRTLRSLRRPRGAWQASSRRSIGASENASIPRRILIRLCGISQHTPLRTHPPQHPSSWQTLPCVPASIVCHCSGEEIGIGDR